MARARGTALICALALSLLYVGCGGDDEDTSTTTASSTETAPTSGDAEAGVEQIDLQKAGADVTDLDGDWLVGTEDGVWDSTGTGMVRLDPDTGEKTGQVNVPGGPCLGSEYAFGALFTATCYDEPGLSRIDPESLEVTDKIELPTPKLYNEDGTIAAGEGAVWVIIDGKGCEACILAGFDPDTLERTHEIDLDQGAASVAVGNGTAWVSDAKHDTVLRIDPKTDKVIGETDVGGLPRYLVVDKNGVWVYNQLEGNVTQLNPDDGEPIRTIETDMAGAGGSITVGEGSVWVRGTLTLLKQIDSETGEIVAQYGPDSGSGDALVRDGVLWVSAFKPGHGTGPGSGLVYRLPLAKAK